MSIPLPVTKMHGTRNDFVVIDNRRATRAVDLDTIVALSRFGTLGKLGKFLCDRHAAVGADGLLVIDDSDSADARMRVINADGSEAEMCGNGIRCVVRYIVEKNHITNDVPSSTMTIETIAGIIEAMVISRSPEFIVRAKIGTPVFEPKELPYTAAFVSLGNPHVVIFDRGMELVEVAPALQQSPLFSDGTNVHLALVTGEGNLTVHHWERGVGETMSCGTGAVAAAAAAIRKGLVKSPVEVHVPGGQLTVEWDGAGVASMSGPAVRVFDAEVFLETGP